MFVVRSSGYMLFFFALAALGYDVITLLEVGTFQLSSWGELWYQTHPDSLSAYQSVVETEISSTLWNQYLAPMLMYKAVLVFAFPALMLTSLPFIFGILRVVAGHFGF